MEHLIHHAENSPKQRYPGIVVCNKSLHVNGTTYAMEFYVLSDGSMKCDIRDINNALETVKKLQGHWAEWDTDKFATLPANQRFMCFIAQEVEKVIPELVKQDPQTKLYEVNSNIAPLLVEAVKELDTSVGVLNNLALGLQEECIGLNKQKEALKQEVTELKNQIEILETKTNQQSNKISELESKLETLLQSPNDKKKSYDINSKTQSSWEYGWLNSNMWRLLSFFLLGRSLSDPVGIISEFRMWRFVIIAVINIIFLFVWIILKLRKNKKEMLGLVKNDEDDSGVWSHWKELFLPLNITILVTLQMLNSNNSTIKVVFVTIIIALFIIIYRLYRDKKRFWGRIVSVVVDLNLLMKIVMDLKGVA